MKKFYLSKTLWANTIMFIAVVAQVIYGEEVIPVKYQAEILAIINVILRFITKEELI